jgi:EpsI family protein
LRQIDADLDEDLRKDRKKATSTRFAAIGSVAMIILASGPALSSLTSKQGSTVNVTELFPPSVVEPWSPVYESSQTWTPRFGGANSQLLKSYSDGNRMVTLYVAYYAHQRRGAEVVNELNRFSDEDAWRRVGTGHFVAKVERQPLVVGYERLASAQTKRLVWYWYWVDGQFTGNRYLAKLLQAKARLFGGTPAAAVIAVAADYQESPEEAVRSLQSFLESVASFEAPLVATARAAAIPGS